MPGQANAMYKIEGNKLVRTHKQCPKCPPGTYMAAHEDRNHCGRCAYTEFQK